MGILIFRVFIVVLVTAAGYFLPFFGLERLPSAGIAFALAVVIMFLETRIRKTQFKVIWGSTVGTFAGVFLGWALGAVYQHDHRRPPDRALHPGLLPDHHALHRLPGRDAEVGVARPGLPLPLLPREERRPELQDPRHERHHRRPHLRPLRHGLHRGHARRPAVRPQGAPARRRLRRRAEAPARPARPGHPRPPPEILPRSRS